MKIKKITARSIQSQLILYFSIAIIIPTIITSVIGTKLIYNQIIRQAEMKTLSDLNSAREIYNNKILSIESIARQSAARSFIVSSVIAYQRDTLQKDLFEILTREKLDIYTIVDTKKKVICRGRNPVLYGDTINDIFVDRVLSSREPVSGTDIVSAEYLMKESPDLVKQAEMKIIPTEKSKPHSTDSLVLETRGMVLKSAVPIFDRNNNMIGILIGGVLLNKNFEIVNKIKHIVHEEEIYRGKEMGTATIFNCDVRVSTNVKNNDGSYAIGTLVSDEVYNTVISKGERFIGDAFVVNAWYIGAYEPIRNIDNNIVGVLYVGLLKEPFDDLMQNTILIFIGIAVGAIVIIIVVAILLARKIAAPLKKLENVAQKVADGNYNETFSLKKAPREVENLASSLNKMAIELESEKNELEKWANTLEEKVQERTEQLKKIHNQLFRSEKLASLGKLAAGVAHEINNPLTGVLTNASLLLEDMEEGDPKREDAEIIVKETIRCREIVKRLLDFARQTKPQRKLVNINSLIENIVLLVKNQTSFRNIVIEKKLQSNLPEIEVDSDQIQQVFVNLIINASEAMQKGGNLYIESKLSDDKDYIEIRFKDTGCGISELNKQKIFDPFFTTKEQGTGLGLSISFGIIERHYGSINLESEPGKGTEFIIHLPVRITEYEE